MKRARVLHNGQELNVTIDADGAIVTAEGAKLDESQIQWLPPVSLENNPTIIALGLNYADHASELEFAAPEEPLVFIKGHNCLTGAKTKCYRPDNIDFMHYECELVAVIGKEAKNVKREDAMDYVAGYTVANDYAIRDFLENYYRPNLRVKSRDSLLPMGPWIVDKDDVADVKNLKIRTWVNGELTQEGTTADMIFDIPFLIEYLSSIMTLQPGDMLCTGTPKGLKDMQPGDTVVCEVEGVGRLENYIVSEAEYYGDRY